MISYTVYGNPIFSANFSSRELLNTNFFVFCFGEFTQNFKNEGMIWKSENKSTIYT